MLSFNYFNWHSSKHLARRVQSSQSAGLNELRERGLANAKHAIYSTIKTISTALPSRFSSRPSFLKGSMV